MPKSETVTIKEREYEDRERELLDKHLRAIEAAPIADRREARTEWGAALQSAHIIVDRVEWLLAGNYGYGACRRADDIVRGGGNRTAMLGILIAGLEWGCPERFARAAWNELNPAQQEKVSSGIASAIAEYEADPTI